MRASSAEFPLLLSPLRIGPALLRNRIVSTGHDTVMAHDGQVSEQLIAYQRARAEGGTGLIVIQVAGVHSSAKYTYHVLMADTDDCIPGYARLVEAIHAPGATAFGQLLHPGREIMQSQEGSLPVSLSASATPNERFRVMPRAMSSALIGEVIEGFGEAASRLQRAGIDGVEIVASHGYLPAQFLNPRVNIRTDEYGGSLEQRLRFLRESIEAVRARVEDRIAVGLRISVDEASHDGLESDEVLEALALLESDGTLDYVSTVVGSSATLSGSDHIAAPMFSEAAYAAPILAPVKAVLSVPVIVTGRVNQPQEAEAILRAGQADAVGMTRALICDPRMPEKAADGRAEEIRACIGCNQACIGHFHLGYPISCIQHPETGHEMTFGTVIPTVTRATIVVVGGGPAGLKAAAVAAERGHRVTLVEQAARVGGQVLTAERIPGRAEFGGAITNLHAEAERAGVEIRTGTRADAQLVNELGAGTVIIATGARPRTPAIEREGSLPVIQAVDVLEGCAVPPGPVLVVDWRSDWVSLGVARALAEAGHRVTLATNGHGAGEMLQQYVRDAMVASLARLGVTTIPLTRLYGVDDDTAYLQHVLTEEPVIVEGLAAVVLAAGSESVDDLGDELESAGVRVLRAGDCLAPRTVEEAVLEGLQAGSLA